MFYYFILSCHRETDGCVCVCVVLFFLLEFGPARVFLLICGFKKRVSQMLSQRRSGEGPHPSINARMYPYEKLAYYCLLLYKGLVPDLHAV